MRARNVRFELYRFYREHYPSSPPTPIASLDDAKEKLMDEIDEEYKELIAENANNPASGISAEQRLELIRNRHNLCSLDCCTCKYWAQIIREVRTLLQSVVEEAGLGYHPLSSNFWDLILDAVYAPENLSDDDREFITLFKQRMRANPKLSEWFKSSAHACHIW